MMSGKNKHNLNDRFQPMKNAKLECYKALMNQQFGIISILQQVSRKAMRKFSWHHISNIDDDLFAYSTNRLQATFDYVITAKSTRS